MPSKKRLVPSGKRKKEPKALNFDHPACRKLEEKLPHKFKERKLLHQALTHSSIGFEMRRQHPDNQRLEFLGDAVLQLVLSNKMFELFPDDGEGMLTKMRTRLVQTGALARVAQELNLGECLQMSRGEEANGGRERTNILADAMEAIIGAVYLDGGFDLVTHCIMELWDKELALVRETPVEQNPKGQLQEILQDQSGLSPSYRIINSEGPDHEKSFCAVVSWNGLDLGQGTGKSKKEAQTAAAVEALTSDTVVALTNQWLRSKGKPKCH